MDKREDDLIIFNSKKDDAAQYKYDLGDYSSRYKEDGYIEEIPRSRKAKGKKNKSNARWDRRKKKNNTKRAIRIVIVTILVLIIVGGLGYLAYSGIGVLRAGEDEAPMAELQGPELKEPLDNGLTDEELAALRDTGFIPSAAMGSSGGILLSSDMTPEMATAEYWINKVDNPDQVLKTKEEIALKNAEIMNQNFIATGSSKNSMNDLDVMVDDFSAKNKQALFGNWIKQKGTYYVNGQAYSSDDWDRLVANCNTGITPTDGAQMGVTVRRTEFKVYPIDGWVGYEADDYTDEYCLSGILPNERILIVHTSADGQWYYGYSSFARGWVKAEDVALCHDKSEWNYAYTADDFLMVTADSMKLDYDLLDDHLDGYELFMGTKLTYHTASDINEILGSRDRGTLYSYIAEIPCRGDDGYLYYESTPIPMGRDVHVGYLDFTVRNILTQAFKPLGNKYSWGGAFNSRDCSEYSMEIYRCFGYVIGRNSSAQVLMPVEMIEWNKKTTNSQKVADLQTVLPGAILRFPGHIMIYLGMEGEVPYCISAAGSYGFSGIEDDVNRVMCVGVNSLYVYRKNTDTWLDDMSHVVMMY